MGWFSAYSFMYGTVWIRRTFGSQEWDATIIQIFSLNKSKAEEAPVIGSKMYTHLKAYMMQKNYAWYMLIHHNTDEHYQSLFTY